MLDRSAAAVISGATGKGVDEAMKKLLTVIVNGPPGSGKRDWPTGDPGEVGPIPAGAGATGTVEGDQPSFLRRIMSSSTGLCWAAPSIRASRSSTSSTKFHRGVGWPVSLPIAASGAPPSGEPPSGPEPGTAAPGRLPPGAPPANGLGNDIFGGVHLVGDKLLRAFGLGGLSDSIASAAGDELPDWARTQEQKNQREREQLEAQKLELQKQKAEAEQRDQDRREKEALALRAIEEAQRSREQLARQKEEQAAVHMRVMAAQPEPPAANQPGAEAAPPAVSAPAQGAELPESENPCGSTVFGPAAFTLEVVPQ